MENLYLGLLLEQTNNMLIDLSLFQINVLSS